MDVPRPFKGPLSVEFGGGGFTLLSAKGSRSGSHRTVESYAGLLRTFFGRWGKTPDRVTAADVVTYAHGIGASGRPPSPHTVGARITALASFFQFCVRLELLDRNPCDRVERPRPPPSTPRGLSADEVQRLLAAIPPTRWASATARSSSSCCSPGGGDPRCCSSRRATSW